MNAKTHKRMVWVVAALCIYIAAVLTSAQEAVAAGVVINEVELNPPGFDTDAEWIELLNTGDTAVDLAGWSVSYSYRVPGHMVISETSLPLSPGARHIFVYPGLRLRNAEGMPIELLDAQGALIDKTPSITDSFDNTCTWQRWPDGGDPAWPGFWLFREGTPDAPNE